MTKEELEQLKESERMQLARALASKACERALREVMREEKSAPVSSAVPSERFVLGKLYLTGALTNTWSTVGPPAH